MRVFTEAQKERARQRAKEWYWANRERSLAASLRWADKNRDVMRARTRKWRADNPERAKENERRKRANRSPEYLRKRCIDEQNRRARIKASGGTLSRGLAARLLFAQAHKCIYCPADLRLGFHLDHIRAIAAGGKNEDANIQLLCPTCNRRKHVKSHEEFARLAAA